MYKLLIFHNGTVGVVIVTEIVQACKRTGPPKVCARRCSRIFRRTTLDFIRIRVFNLSLLCN